MECTPIVVFCLVAFLNSSYGQTLEPSNEKTSFTLEEISESKFVNNAFEGIWAGGDKYLYKSFSDYLMYDITNRRSTVFLNGAMTNKNINKVYPAADGIYGLIESDVQWINKYTKTARYTLYSHRTRESISLRPVANSKRLQYCAFMGDTNQLIYVLDNSIYWVSNLDAKTIAKKISLKTSGDIYLGVPDWIYAEKVFASDNAIWIPPNAEYLVFAQFDDTNVDSFHYVNYEGSVQYPTVNEIKYPMVRTTNPSVSLYHYNLTSNATENYARNIKFTIHNERLNNIVLKGVALNDTDIFILYTNREQNKGYLVKCDKKLSCKEDTAYPVTGSWLDVSLPVFSKSGSMMAQIQPYNGYQQLWLKPSAKVPNQPVFVAIMDKKTVIEIYGLDEQNVYYSAAEDNKHFQKHVYAYNYIIRQDTCLTCNFTTPEGPCAYASASFSNDFSYYARICEGPGPNYITLDRPAPGFQPFQPIIYAANDDTRNLLKRKLLPQVEDVSINMGYYDIAVRLLLPPNMDRSRKYPMIVDVNAAPNTNQIKDAFSVGLEKYVVTNMSYIYAYIDGRGSGLRGNNLKDPVYKRLGTIEIDDQINATKKLLTMYDFIDETKIGIWGWGYGGFAAATALTRDSEDIFKCGISVAPITRFYLCDSFTTEKYMGLYQDNSAAYDAVDFAFGNKLLKFEGKNFMLIHGSADVHYHQSMLFAKDLESANIHFLQVSYPGETDLLENRLPHLYREIITFWKDNFGTVDNNDNNGCGGVRMSMGLVGFCTLLITLVYL